MSWIVRFYPQDSMDAGDLESAIEIMASQLWDLGTTGVFEPQQPTNPTNPYAAIPSVQPALLGAGFDSRHEADAAAAAAERLGFATSVRPANDSWHGSESTTVELSTGAGDVTFTLVAGPSFGHGSHPTTTLTLDLMSQIDQPLGNVLDLGTGSGVLAIAAHHLGAASITAIDIDPVAVATADKNLATNEVEARCSAIPIEQLAEEGATFDLIVANVLLPVHQQVAETVTAVLASPGLIVASGFLDSQRDQVVEAYRGHRGDLQINKSATLDGWQALLLM